MYKIRETQEIRCTELLCGKPAGYSCFFSAKCKIYYCHEHKFRLKNISYQQFICNNCLSIEFPI